MNPEELKAIIEMIGGLGASTMNGFIAYIVFKCIAVFVAYGVGTLCAVFVYRLGKYGIETVYNLAHSTNTIVALRRDLSMETYGGLSRGETDTFAENIREMIKKGEN